MISPTTPTGTLTGSRASERSRGATRRDLIGRVRRASNGGRVDPRPPRSSSARGGRWFGYVDQSWLEHGSWALSDRWRATTVCGEPRRRSARLAFTVGSPRRASDSRHRVGDRHFARGGDRLPCVVSGAYGSRLPARAALLSSPSSVRRAGQPRRARQLGDAVTRGVGVGLRCAGRLPRGEPVPSGRGDQ